MGLCDGPSQKENSWICGWEKGHLTRLVSLSLFLIKPPVFVFNSTPQRNNQMLSKLFRRTDVDFWWIHNKFSTRKRFFWFFIWIITTYGSDNRRRRDVGSTTRYIDKSLSNVNGNESFWHSFPPPPPWVKLTTRASSCNTRLHTKFYFAKTHQLCMELIINILVTIIVTRSSFFFLSRLLPSIILTQLSTGHILPSKLCSRTTHWIEEDRWPVPIPSAIHKKKKKNGFRKSENMMMKTVCVIQPIIHRYMTNRVPLYKCRSNIGSRFSPISWTHKNDICPCASQPPPPFPSGYGNGYEKVGTQVFSLTKSTRINISHPPQIGRL